MEKQINPYGLPMKLKAKDIARHFNIGISTVWLYRKQGKLIGIKVTDGCTLFETKQVVEFFNGK